MRLKTEEIVEWRKRDETNTEESIGGRNGKSKHNKKEIMISYTKTERGMNRIKEDKWKRRKVRKRKISTGICCVRKFCWTYWSMNSLCNRTVALQICRFRSTKLRPLAAGSNSPTDVCLTALLKGGKTDPRARRSSDRKLGHTALLPFVHSTPGKSCHLQYDSRSFIAHFTTCNELLVLFSNFLLQLKLMTVYLSLEKKLMCGTDVTLRS